MACETDNPLWEVESRLMQQPDASHSMEFLLSLAIARSLARIETLLNEAPTTGD